MLFSFLSLSLISTTLLQSAKFTLDVVFVIDSSDSVSNSDPNNFYKQTNFVIDIINNGFPTDTRVGFINFGGCGSTYTLENCYRVVTEFTLTEFGNPNDLTLVTKKINTIIDVRGRTWTNEALTVALDLFIAGNSTQNNRTKVIILVTDGVPCCIEARKPCNNAGFVSNTLTTIRDTNVNLITVVVRSGISAIEYTTYIECLARNCTANCHIYDVTHFDAFNSNNLTNNITNFIYAAGPDPTEAPTFEPTTEPTTQPTLEPTLEPIVNPTTNPTGILSIKTSTRLREESSKEESSKEDVKSNDKIFEIVLIVTLISAFSCFWCLIVYCYRKRKNKPERTTQIEERRNETMDDITEKPSAETKDTQE